MANNNPVPVQLWFDNLKKIQGRLKTLNHLTKDDLKEFSKQQLGELLLSDTIKGNLSQFCQTEHIGLVPNGAFDDPKKTFFFFLDRISFSVEESLRTLAFDVATQFNPALLGKPKAEVMAMTLSEVYGPDPLSTNPAKQELNGRLTATVPSTFYPTDGSFLEPTSQKVFDMLLRIGSKGGTP